jgi:DNA primase
VARTLGLEPKRAGKEWVVRCPFHDDRTPSLSINQSKGVWHCFSCGSGGDVISLIQGVKRLGFADAVKELAA